MTSPYRQEGFSGAERVVREAPGGHLFTQDEKGEQMTCTISMNGVERSI
jgi:hypothetical protein